MGSIPTDEITYLIFLLGVEAKRGVEFRHSTRNESRIRECNVYGGYNEILKKKIYHIVVHSRHCLLSSEIQYHTLQLYQNEEMKILYISSPQVGIKSKTVAFRIARFSSRTTTTLSIVYMDESNFYLIYI